MTEYIGDKFFGNPTGRRNGKGLMSRNRLFTFRNTPDHGIAIERQGKLVKQLAPNVVDYYFGSSGPGGLPQPVIMGYDQQNQMHIVCGVPGGAVMDRSTALLMLHDNGELTIGDRYGTRWSSGTGDPNVPLSTYKLKDEKFEPLRATPVGMQYAKASIDNSSDIEQVNEVELSWQEAETIEVKLDHSSQWEVNSKVALEVGLPFFNAAKGSIEVGGSYGQTVTTGMATSVSRTTGFKHTVNVRTPAHSSVTVTANGSMIKAQGLKFTATMEITYADGSTETFPASGIINTAGIYSDFKLNFEQKSLKDNASTPVASDLLVDAKPVERFEVVPGLPENRLPMQEEVA